MNFSNNNSNHKTVKEDVCDYGGDGDNDNSDPTRHNNNSQGWPDHIYTSLPTYSCQRGLNSLLHSRSCWLWAACQCHSVVCSTSMHTSLGARPCVWFRAGVPVPWSGMAPGHDRDPGSRSVRIISCEAFTTLIMITNIYSTISSWY